MMYKKISHNPPKLKMFCKKISEIFDIFFFFPGCLEARFDVFCKKDFFNFYPFSLFLGFLAKLGSARKFLKTLSSSLSFLASFYVFCKIAAWMSFSPRLTGPTIFTLIPLIANVYEKTKIEN